MLLVVVFIQAAQAQSQEVQQLLLNVEKLAQFKQILSDMKKGYQVLSTGYNTVKDLSEGNFDLHKTFLDGLMEVSPAVRKYRKVSEIIEYQVLLVKEYKAAHQRFRQSGQFNAGELDYLNRVYTNLFNQSLKNLDQLAMVVTAGKMRMNDAERLEAIDRVHADMNDQLQFLRTFNNNNTQLAMQRAKAANDVAAIRSLYGITN